MVDRRYPVALREVLDHLPDPFVVFDEDWRYAYANPAAVSVLGGDDLIGENVGERFPDVVGSTVHRRLLRAMENRELTDFRVAAGEFG